MIRLNVGSPGAARDAISIYIWVAFAVFLVGFSLLKEALLPGRFFYDTQTIDSMIDYTSSFVPGASYASTAYFYSLIGADLSSGWLTVGSTLMVGWTLLVCIRRLHRSSIGLGEAAMVMFFGALAMTYVACLSKELIAFIPTTIFFLLLPLGQRIALCCWLVLVLCYGLIFRTYWVLFALQFIVLYLVFSRTRSVKLLFFCLFFSLMCMTIILHFGLGVDLDSLRNDVNERRLDQGVEDARTMIQPWIGGGGYVFSYLNFVITFVLLLVPVPLGLMLTAYHGLIFLVLSSVAWQVARRLKQYTNRASSRDPLFEFSVIAVLSFISIQCMFEPDYGSYLRHLSPLYPMILICAYRGVLSSVEERRGRRQSDEVGAL